MKCPFCGFQESKVVDSRHSDDNLSIRRRRECLGCQRRFTTYEMVESLPMVVVKKDGSRQNFDKSKILTGLQRSCVNRPVPISELERITNEIEQAVMNSMEREISTGEIGEMVMERLKPLDEVSYIRFASVYRQFKDVNSFMRELTKIHEEVVRTTLDEAIARYTADAPRGEFVLVVGGAPIEERERMTPDEAVHIAARYVEDGMSVSEAAKRAAAESGCKKGDIYRLLIQE